MLWPYVCCQWILKGESTHKPKKQASNALFLKMGKWLRHFPQPRFLPRLGLWECHYSSTPLVVHFHNFQRSTSTFCASSNFVTSSRERMSEGLLWLGTVSIQTGRSNFSSVWNMRLINLMLSSFADQLLRKASHCLTVSKQNNTTGTDSFFPGSKCCKNCHHLKLLDDRLLTIGHYVVKQLRVCLLTKERETFF